MSPPKNRGASVANAIITQDRIGGSRGESHLCEISCKEHKHLEEMVEPDCFDFPWCDSDFLRKGY
jgi:hypothetical protein